MLGRTLGVGGPVGRQDQEVGPQQGQHAGRLGERAIIADVHADPHARNLVDGERPVARVHEHVDAQKRQVHLAIRPDHTLRSDQDAGIEQPPSVTFQESEDAAAAGARGQAGDLADLGAVDRHGMSEALLTAAEAIARQRALGEDRQLGPRGGRLVQSGRDPLEVLRDPTELRLHLHGRHTNRFR